MISRHSTTSEGCSFPMAIGFHLVGYASLVMLALCCGISRAQFPMVREAEKCAIACAAGDAPQETIWARGRKVTPAFWGQAVGDSVKWGLTLPHARGDLHFGLRYSYAGAPFEARPRRSRERVLQLMVDNGKPIALHVPATGWWEQFDTVSVALPRLSAGSHSIRVVSPAPNTITNIDTLMVFSGPLGNLPVKLRKTIIAESPAKHFFIRVTPNAPLPVAPDALFKDFEHIYAFYLDYMGWAPAGPIGINLIEDDKWPEPGATAFQNDRGVFFRAGAMATEQGNWLHEMTHMFYVGHFPRWLDEPSVRTITKLVWAPALLPEGADPPLRRAYKPAMDEGASIWSDPSATYAGVEPILNALVARYGRDVYRLFFHACAAAGAKGELEFKPGRWMTKAEIVRYMTAAAGEDVAPLFNRWRGCAAE